MHGEDEWEQACYGRSAPYEFLKANTCAYGKAGVKNEGPYERV